MKWEYETSDSRWRPGEARRLIKPMNDLEPGQKVVLCCRVSSHKQRSDQNLADSEANLRREAEQRQLVVVGTYRHVGSGWDRGWLCLAADKAKEHGATLLAESTDRFARHPIYHSSKCPNVRARTSDLDDLRWWTIGVPLATVIHPDAAASEVRSYQRRRGQHEKSSFGGRPGLPGYKKRLRQKKLPKVLELKERGASLRKIVAKTRLAKSTIADWIRRCT
jgi:DNA invertase Pin-like site-specific DNA recombinase